MAPKTSGINQYFGEVALCMANIDNLQDILRNWGNLKTKDNPTFGADLNNENNPRKRKKTSSLKAS